MRIVLDTNCFLSCIGKRSPYRPVFDAYLDGRYDLCVSSEILLEYEERFNIFWGEEVTRNLMGVLLTQENTLLQTVHFNFMLVVNDPDDDKFTDTYLSAGADLLVTNDRHLLSLNPKEFPYVRMMTLQDFCEVITKGAV